MSDVPIPSWASRTESEGSQDQRTVLNNSAAKNKNPNAQSPQNIDDIPIVAPKTFEEILAEQLGNDNQAPATLSTPKNESPAFVRRAASDKPRTFLKKKSGLARFNGAGSPPKAFRRSKSQNNVNNDTAKKVSGNINGRVQSSKSCSKLDIANRETISFSSKKAPAKKSAIGPNKSKPSTTSKNNGQSVMSTSTGSMPEKSSSVGKNKLLKSALSKGTSSSLKELPLRSQIAIDGRNSPGFDSVEVSFQEKLKKASKVWVNCFF